MRLGKTHRNLLNLGTGAKYLKIASKARKDRHGGVAIFTNPDCTSFAASCSNLFERASLESCAAKIITNRGKVVYLLCAYVPPQQEEQLKLLNESIQQANLENLILMGDLNGKSPEWNNTSLDKHGEIIESMLSDNKLTIHNDGQPTRRGGHSVIDLIITSVDIGNLVTSCSTLTHETVRSDHKAILSDIEIDTQETYTETKEMRQLKKTDWHKWRERTEQDFEGWPGSNVTRFDDAYTDFTTILTEAYNEVVPTKEVKFSNRRLHPCWWNDNVRSAKKSLNHHQRKFRKRNTIQNKLNLITAEDNFQKAKEDAQEKWTSDLIDKFEDSSNPKEMWNVYKKMTRRPESNSVLPLIKDDSPPIFDPSEECTLLQNNFFDCYQKCCSLSQKDPSVSSTCPQLHLFVNVWFSLEL